MIITKGDKGPKASFKGTLVALSLAILVFAGWLAVSGNLQPFLADGWLVVEFFQFLGAVLWQLVPPLTEDAPHVDGLATDEEMIRNFCRNRQDFDRLAQLYRGDATMPIQRRYLVPTPGVLDIMKRIKVISVKGDNELWNVSETERELMARTPDLNCRLYSGDQDLRKLVGVRLRYAHKPTKRARYGQPIWKEYYYIPVVPNIEHGVLKLPGPFCDPLPAPTMAQTLDRYPPKFATWDCALREIATHWYIRMCQEK